jgi:N-acetylmuramoyl-L-alanine amidase
MVKPLPRFEPTISASHEHKKDRLIVIDIGHGGKDSGAVGYSGLKEKDIVLEVGNKIAKRLRSFGYRVSMSRDSDVFVELPDRTKMANDKNGDLFLSIHANAVANNITAKGIETYFLSPARSDRAKRVALKENAADVRMMDDGALSTFLNVLNKEKIVASHKLAIDVHGTLLKKLRSRYDDIRDNGVREAPFWVLVGAQMPAILVELGYITNPTEAQRMDNPLYQDLLAEGIVAGIEGYLKNN